MIVAFQYKFILFNSVFPCTIIAFLTYIAYLLKNLQHKANIPPLPCSKLLNLSFGNGIGKLATLIRGGEGHSFLRDHGHATNDRRVVKMIVAISFEKGVNFFEKYDKLYGAYFADFVRRNFRTMFRKSGKKCSKLFVQDNALF